MKIVRKISDKTIKSSGYCNFHRDIKGEVPTGDINGVNLQFTLSEIPLVGSTVVRLNGEIKILDTDYTEDAENKQINFIVAPITDDVLMIDYKNPDYDQDIYEEVEVEADSADVKYMKFDGEDNFISMTQEEKDIVDNNESKETLRVELIELAKKIKACQDLIDLTTLSAEEETEVTNEKTSLESTRDSKITELNAL